jgi:superfamily II DNA or RNA helicase
MIAPISFGGRQARVYQVAARNEVITALEEGHERICVVLPTGAGKTLTAGLIIDAPDLRKVLNIPANQPIRVLMIAHRHRLLKQAADSYAEVEGFHVLKDDEYKATPMCAGYTGVCTDNILFTTLSTFGTIPNDLRWDIAFLDEAHHEAMLTFQYKLEQVSKTPIIGLTATPSRADGVLCKFSKFVETLSREDAVAAGFLADSSVYSFIDSPAREHVDMVMDIVELKQKDLGQTMVFVRTKHEAVDLQQRLAALKLTSVALVNVKEKTLNAELIKFEKGEVQFVISCNKIGEGTDVKGCESIIIGRTTQSLPLLNQLIGRSARPDCESKIFEIINPLSNSNLTASDVVDPHHHEIWYKVRHQWRHQVIA